MNRFESTKKAFTHRSHETGQSFARLLEDTSRLSFCTLIDSVRFHDYITKFQLSHYPARDPLYIYENTLKSAERSSVSFADMLLLSCCYGMGIGTALDLAKSMTSCVKAGLNGYIPAILTTVSLFEACRQANLGGEFRIESMTCHQIASYEVSELETIIERWTLGDWGEASIHGLDKVNSQHHCRLMLPRAFTETPAARRLCLIYPRIREKICTRSCICVPKPLQGRVELPRVICGRRLLAELAKFLEAGTLHQEVRATGL